MSAHQHSRNILTLVAGVTAAAHSAHAVEPSDILAPRFGALSIRPHLALAERYDDNIFFRSATKQDDFITQVTPGINFTYGREELNYVSLDYTLNHLTYLNNSDLSANEHFFSNGMQFQGNKLTFQSENQVRFYSNVIGGGVAGEREGVVDRVRFDDLVSLEYSISRKTGVYVEGRYDAVDYDSGFRRFDVNTLEGTGGFSYQAFPKTRFFGELFYGQTATDPNTSVQPKGPHSEFIGGFLGVRGEFTAKLTGSLKGGVESRWYSMEGIPTTTAPVVETGLTYQYSPKTTATLNYRRRTRVSDQSVGTSIVRDSVTLGWDQVIGDTGKIVGSLGVSYIMDQFENFGFFADRNDNYIRANADLTYQFKIWLQGQLSYEYEHFTSDSARIVDYDANRVTISLAVGY